MRHVKKLDLRMNRLVLTALETNYFSVFERLTHVDVRDNRIGELDVTAVRTLEYLNCERNAMSTLRASGTALKNLFAACNCEQPPLFHWPRARVLNMGTEIFFCQSISQST